MSFLCVVMMKLSQAKLFTQMLRVFFFVLVAGGGMYLGVKAFQSQEREQVWYGEVGIEEL